MLSVHEGDIKGVWLAASAPVLTASAPIVGVSLVAKLLTGHGLPVSMLPAPVVHVTAHLINMNVTNRCLLTAKVFF